MAGILIVTHGDFGVEIKKSAELIAGPIENCKVLGLHRSDDIMDLKASIDGAIEELAKDDDVIVLCDLFGGSPCNMSTLCLKQRGGFKVVSGLNIIMLIEVAMMRESMAIDELAAHAVTAGVAGIKVIDA